MQPKQAIQKAKDIVAEMFADENPLNIGLEEIEYDDRDDVWKVTVGFDRVRGRLARQADMIEQAVGLASKYAPLQREYKIVSLLDEDGKMLSIKDHELARL